MKPALFMGDPSYFTIRGGHNPHTRTRFGFRKKVDRKRAIRQWHGLAEALAAHGALVFVMPPVPQHPGTVFPANAGFLTKLHEPRPLSEKSFYLGNLIGHRSGEQPHYRDFLEGLGIRTKPMPHRFEGEADFFPSRSGYLFTYGRLTPQHFVFQFGIPPYRRIYGFRSDERNVTALERIASPQRVIPLELVKETHYHGDTCLFAFGEEQEFLAVYLEAFSEPSQEKLKRLFGGRLVVLTREDGERFAANSFQLITDQGSFLFMPQGCSGQLQSEVRTRGAIPVLVDVSEFMETGGGSVKCLIATLGPMELDDPSLNPKIREARHKALYVPS